MNINQINTDQQNKKIITIIVIITITTKNSIFKP